MPFGRCQHMLNYSSICHHTITPIHIYLWIHFHQIVYVCTQCGKSLSKTMTDRMASRKKGKWKLQAVGDSDTCKDGKIWCCSSVRIMFLDKEAA